MGQDVLADGSQIESIYIKVLGNKATHILIIGVALLSVIFMRKLHELKLISYLFMMAIFVFLLLVSAELT